MFIHWGCKDSPETPQTLEICEGKVYQRNKILIRNHINKENMYINTYIYTCICIKQDFCFPFKEENLKNLSESFVGFTSCTCRCVLICQWTLLAI